MVGLEMGNLFVTADENHFFLAKAIKCDILGTAFLNK